MDEDSLGPQLAEFRCNPRQVDKAKRIVRQILAGAPELQADVMHHVPFIPHNDVPLNWALGFDPNEQLVLTVRLRTRQVELIG
jgi:hypothetical protein